MTTTQEIIQRIPTPIAKVFGGREHLTSTVKFIEWNKMFCPRDYIDSICPEDMGERHIVVGMDDNNRAFIAFKTIEYSPQCEEGNTIVIVLFQRHGDDINTWTCAGGAGGIRMVPPGRYITNGDPNKVDKIAQKSLDLYERVVKRGFKCYSGFDT
jgi:hypothetical protein